MGDILIVGLVGALTASIILLVQLRRIRRKARSEVEAGRPASVPAAIRKLDAGWWDGRWRHGSVTYHVSELQWQPKFLRPGRSFKLEVAEISNPRAMRWYEHWWLASDMEIFKIKVLGGADESYELAMLSITKDAIFPGESKRRRP